MSRSIPYTFVSEDHFWKFADSELAEEFLLEPHNVGLPMRGLCYGEEGFRNFSLRMRSMISAILREGRSVYPRIP